MKTFVKGFLLGSVIAATSTLLNNSTDGAHHRLKLQAYLSVAKEEGQKLVNEGLKSKEALSFITGDGLKTVTTVTNGLTHDIQRFSQEIQPALRKISGLITSIQQEVTSLSSEKGEMV